ncbi:MAG TPA: PepSY domain-containing protein [Longimicrobiaceae bacterium]|jgi:hypothetical protein|nr:PepSY domain-containing protein [Longimicrobiaceae bacterium]
MKSWTLAAVAAAALLAWMRPGAAQTAARPDSPRSDSPHAAPAGPPIRESRPGLTARARVRPDAARHLALARYPGGQIVDELLVERQKRLLYDFTIRPAGNNAPREVLVNAATGQVIGVRRNAPAIPRAALVPRGA